MTQYNQYIIELNKNLYYQEYLFHRMICAKIFMDLHYAESINLDKISNAAHCSKYHFIRVFMRYYGQTPNQYLRGLRISMAIESMTKNFHVPTACYACGFTSINSFRSLFKKYTGLSPLVWKKAILECGLRRK